MVAARRWPCSERVARLVAMDCLAVRLPGVGGGGLCVGAWILRVRGGARIRRAFQRDRASAAADLFLFTPSPARARALGHSRDCVDRADVAHPKRNRPE